MRLRKPCTMHVRGYNNVGRAVRTDPTLLSYFSAITSKEMLAGVWLKSFTSFKLCPTTPMQQHATTCNRVCKRTQRVTSNNVGSWWPTMLRSFARGLSHTNVYRVFLKKRFDFKVLDFGHFGLIKTSFQPEGTYQFYGKKKRMLKIKKTL